VCFYKEKGHWKSDCPRLNKLKNGSQSETNIVKLDSNNYDSSYFTLLLHHLVVIQIRLSGYWIRVLSITSVPEGSSLLAPQH